MTYVTYRDVERAYARKIDKEVKNIQTRLEVIGQHFNRDEVLQVRTKIDKLLWLIEVYNKEVKQ